MRKRNKVLLVVAFVLVLAAVFCCGRFTAPWGISIYREESEYLVVTATQDLVESQIASLDATQVVLATEFAQPTPTPLVIVVTKEEPTSRVTNSTVTTTPTETPSPVSGNLCIVEDNSGFWEDHRQIVITKLTKSIEEDYPEVSVVGFEFFSPQFFETDCLAMAVDYTVNTGYFGPKSVAKYLDIFPDVYVIGYSMYQGWGNKHVAQGLIDANILKPNVDAVVLKFQEFLDSIN